MKQGADCNSSVIFIGSESAEKRSRAIWQHQLFFPFELWKYGNEFGRILRSISTFIVYVTRPPLENHLNWVPDPVPLPARCSGDLAAPSPSENTPPQDASSKLPRWLRPRRRRERQSGLSTNSNSASRVAGPATQLGSPANRNSAHPSSSTATRPRSAANKNLPLPGQRPGTSRSNMSAPAEHPRTFLRPQYPRLSANQNSGHRFDSDHPEIRGVYKPAQPSTQEDYHSSIR